MPERKFDNAKELAEYLETVDSSYKSFAEELYKYGVSTLTHLSWLNDQHIKEWKEKNKGAYVYPELSKLNYLKVQGIAMQAKKDLGRTVVKGMATVHRVKQAGVDDVVYTSNTEGWENRAANHEPAVTKPYDMHYTTAKPGSKPQDSDYKSYDGSKFDAVKKAVEDGEEVWLKFVKYTVHILVAGKQQVSAFTVFEQGWEKDAAKAAQITDTKSYNLSYTTAQPGSKPEAKDYKDYDDKQIDAVKAAAAAGQEVWLKFAKKATGAPK